MGIISGFKDPTFVERFGPFLDKVEDADIAALLLYLPPQDSLVKSLSELAKHMYETPLGRTGLPYFDEWQIEHDNPKDELVVKWSIRRQDKPRALLVKGFRIGKSKSNNPESSGVFVTVFVKN